MDYRQLGRSDIKVSAICLGTMTWGEQNTEDQAHAQMDYATEHGINFFDTAEMYPIPPKKETYARTETMIGNWFKKTGKRDQIILASKVFGPGNYFSYGRENGTPRLDKANIQYAVDNSLKRLQTDVIDLYQIHWPARPASSFRHIDPKQDETPIAETLEALAELVTAGKVRQIGISNETAWGTMEYIRLSEVKGYPRIASIQNAHNLLNRTFEMGLAEIALRESCGLLAYSPLAGGTLSGKYLDGQIPPGSRRDIDPRPSRYGGQDAESATHAYVSIARHYGLDPAQMALNFVAHQNFVTSAIIGATNMNQLATDIASFDIDLPDEAATDIQAIHALTRNPCP